MTLPALAQPASRCEETPTIHATAPHDDGVDPLTGDWFVNADRSIWGARLPYPIRAGVDEKVPWIRPAGVKLLITGRRLDGQSAPLKASTPGNATSAFTPSGMLFPSAGCWEVTGRAADKELKYIIQVQPKGSRPR